MKKLNGLLLERSRLGFVFALHPHPHELQFPVDQGSLVWRHTGIGKQGGEFGKVDAFGVGFFQDHGPGRFCLTNWQAPIVRLVPHALRVEVW